MQVIPSVSISYMVYEQSKRKWVPVQVFREPFFECYHIGWVYSQNYVIQSILASMDITRHSTGLTLVYDYLSLVDPSTSRCHYISISHSSQPLAAPAYLSITSASRSITRLRARSRYRQ